MNEYLNCVLHILNIGLLTLESLWPPSFHYQLTSLDLHTLCQQSRLHYLVWRDEEIGLQAWPIKWKLWILVFVSENK